MCHKSGYTKYKLLVSSVWWHTRRKGGGNARRSSLSSLVTPRPTQAHRIHTIKTTAKCEVLWAGVWARLTDICDILISLWHLLSLGSTGVSQWRRCFQEVEWARELLTSPSRQLICFIYPSSCWWFMRWQTLLSMNRDKRHSDSCLWLLIKTLPRIQWGGNFTPLSHRQSVGGQRILTWYQPSTGLGIVPIRENREVTDTGML